MSSFRKLYWLEFIISMLEQELFIESFQFSGEVRVLEFSSLQVCRFGAVSNIPGFF